ncbi:hypothetical protein DPV78_009189 [Talaromyces pinophilus]|nr:hypothetical protein DPV78_009189 [Talaromyces pinophilus]
MSSLPITRPAIHPDSLVNSNRTNKRTIERTRTGCRTCRTRKVKCDEKRPACTQCCKGQRNCEWPEPADKRARVSRRANSTACNTCKKKKVCSNDNRDMVAGGIV